MSSFKLSVLSPNNPFFVGECVSLIIPTTDGKYGILAHHDNAIITVVPGIIEFTLPDGQKRTATVSEGVLKIRNNEVLILADCVKSE